MRELRAAAVAGDLPQSLVDIAGAVIEGETPRFQLTVEGRPRALHALVAEEMRRIAEEAIRNVVQHARAASLEVLVSFERSGVRMTIRDDGVGIEEETLEAGGTTDHYGLVGMRERAERIGAMLILSSRKQQAAPSWRCLSQRARPTGGGGNDWRVS